ncbi:MAG: sarcosine oxidase subunit gamma family protein [Pseudomonadota bacterium]
MTIAQAGPQRRSPLFGRDVLASPDGAARLEDRAFLAKVILRGEHKAVQAGVKKSLGAELPALSPHTAKGSSESVLWLSPDEWMVVGAADSESDIQQRLSDALSGVHHQVANVTDYYTTISLSGSAARSVLMKLTMLDVHKRAFKAGEVRGTMLMHCQAIIHQTAEDDADGPAFDIHVRWSMADYLWCLIAEAGREFGLPAQTPITGERLVI